MHNATPAWLKKRLILGNGVFETKAMLAEHRVATVCESSLCPNLNECFSARCATFLILGGGCTRSCAFCSVGSGSPEAVDRLEAFRISDAIVRLGLRHVVITSVTRDDLPDGGAQIFAHTVGTIRRLRGNIGIEVLTPDLRGLESAVRTVVESGPDVFGHNIETVERLYSVVRRGSEYSRSLGVLRSAKYTSKSQVTKSGIMLGLGESGDEVVSTLEDIRAAGCDMLTIGQYLRPGPGNIPVQRFVHPDEFEKYARIGREMGFRHIASGPFVRSSYRAEEACSIVSKGGTDDRCQTSAACRGSR